MSHAATYTQGPPTRFKWDVPGPGEVPGINGTSQAYKEGGPTPSGTSPLFTCPSWSHRDMSVQPANIVYDSRPCETRRHDHSPLQANIFFQPTPTYVNPPFAPAANIFFSQRYTNPPFARAANIFFSRQYPWATITAAGLLVHRAAQKHFFKWEWDVPYGYF
ncbi:hypothetical protein FB451DRAFT_1194929 [Mycena latifolia]|nr:hypothetical protein FB451DRAFT_1194929 [Mycena latifolia]